MTLIGGTFNHKGIPCVTITPTTNQYDRHANPQQGEQLRIGFRIDDALTQITEETAVTIIVQTLNTSNGQESAYSEKRNVAFLRNHFIALGQPLTDDDTWQKILNLSRTVKLSASLERYYATPPEGFISVQCLTEPPAEDKALHFIKITGHNRKMLIQREIRYVDPQTGRMTTTQKDTISWAHFVQNYANDKGEPLSAGDNASLFLRKYFRLYPPLPDSFEPPAL